MKKIISTLLIIALVLSMTVSASAGPRRLGDVTDDGTVGISDALQILRFLVNLPNQVGEPEDISWHAALITQESRSANTPGIADALQILRYLVGLPNLIQGQFLRILPSFVSSSVSQIVVVGQDAVFTVIARGSPEPEFQWQVSTDNGRSWTFISGETDSTLTLTAVTADMDGNRYRAIATNSVGAMASDSMLLTVNIPPSFTDNPAYEAVLAGGNAVFTVAAEGRPEPTLQWQVSEDNGVTWTDISGATGAILTLSGVTAVMDGNMYRSVATNSAGASTSEPAVLTVSSPPSFTTSPASRTAMTGETVTFTAAVTGNPAPTLQWQLSSNGGLTWTDISGETGSSLTLTNITTAMGGNMYRAVATNLVGTAMSEPATLAVHPQSSITLPNRRLSDTERETWIADYWTLGGPSHFELEIVRLVNEIRVGYGLSYLQIDNTLKMAARFYAQTMSDLNTGLGHNMGPYRIEGATHGASANVAAAFGAQLRWNGGNGAWSSSTGFGAGYRTPESIVERWMNSPGHRAYIVSPEHRYIGAGAYGTPSSHFKYLFMSDRPSLR